MTDSSIIVRSREGGWEFAKAYIVTMRPYLMFVSGITGIAGLSFSPGTAPERTLLIGLASFLSYGFGQALTDAFHTDTDSISAPYRPLTRGLVSGRQVVSASVAGLAVCVGVFAFFNRVNAVLGLAAGIGLATYTPFKRRWWGGPFYNAWIVAVLCLMAGAAGGIGPSWWTRNHLLLLLAVFFGYANFVLAGYFKDVDADRSTGYNTLVVRFGRRVSAYVSDLFALVALFAGAVILLASSAPPVSWLFIGSASAASVLAQVRLHRVATDARAHRAISPVVHGYILLLSGVAAMQQPQWSAPLAVFYAAFTAVMKARPEKTQI